MSAPSSPVRRLATTQLTDEETIAIRAILSSAFEGHGEGFTDDDWDHAKGGVHFVLDKAGVVLAHAAVVERELQANGLPIRAGYVEAVATRPDHQREGLGTRVMAAVQEHILATYELGALSAAAPAFYARLGWERWLGPTAVRTATGEVRTRDDDGDIMVLPTPTSPPLDRRALLSCPWRPGDVW
jgi:aminoglycoside 2'-N-acetyltransferase I